MSMDADTRANGAPPAGCPVSAYDPYETDMLLDPYPGYAELRALGGVVYLSHYGIYALPRHQTASAALDDWRSFSSAHGVMLNEQMNSFMRGTLLCSDPPVHDDKRDVIMGPLTPPALRCIRDEIAAEAEQVVDKVLEMGTINAVSDLAEKLPMSIVATRVGIPGVERRSMLDWAKYSFDCIGPIDKPRTQHALAQLGGFADFVQKNSSREQVAPGSWLEGLYLAADAGKIPHEACGPMAIDYIGPSLDTTISALSNAVWLFANHPDQWDLVRENPALIARAINEVVRLESPIQGWTRYVNQTVEMDGVTLPEGSRVLVMFGSANRDEEKWGADAARFDVNRSAADHLAFGRGEHACAGANMARMEMIALLTALAKRVERFEWTGEPVREVNNIVRAWRELPVRIRPG